LCCASYKSYPTTSFKQETLTNRKGLMTLSWFKRNKNKKKKPNDEAAAELPSSEEMASPQPPEIEQSLTDEADGPQSPEISVEDSDEEQQTTPDENPTAEIEVEPGSSPEQAKTGYFIRLRKRLSRTRKSLSSGFDRAFAGKKKIDDEVLEELEEGSRRQWNSLSEFQKLKWQMSVR
jgi:signal recognition particle GTPase